MTKPQIKKILWAGLPLLIFILIGVYWLARTRSTADQFPLAEDNLPPDVYSEKTFDHIADPTETRTCLPDINSYELIKDSELLQSHKIRVWVGGSFDNGLMIPKACDNKEKGPFSVITKSALASVMENPDSGEASTLEWECGGTLPAQKFLFKAGESHTEALFLVTGENSEEFLEWHPASKTTAKSNCLNSDPDYQMSVSEDYEIKDLKLRYAVQTWKVKATEEEACTLPVASLGRLVLNQKPVCQNQLESQFTCHGLPTDSNEDPAIGVILGVLTVKEKSGSTTVENWLIFTSPGYEWSGFSVAPIDSEGRVDKKRVQTVVYAGC